MTGQTYSRKVDAQVLVVHCRASDSRVTRRATDLRILQDRKEIEEPFEKEADRLVGDGVQTQPDAGERICALARFAMTRSTACRRRMATQWMERTLDDSADRRL